MQKWVHPTPQSSTLYGLHDFLMTAPSLLGMKWTSWRHFARSIFFHSPRMTSFRDWMLDGEWCSTCLFRIPHRCSIGFRSGDILGHWITFTLFFFRNPTVALDVCLGSLSCWKSARRPRARSDGSIFSFSIEQYICEFMMPSMKCSSPTPAALMHIHDANLPFHQILKVLYWMEIWWLWRLFE